MRLCLLSAVLLSTVCALSPNGKIAPWLFSHAQDAESLEFFVVLNAKADLSKADALETKLQKGRFVRDSLWETAQKSQASLIEFLQNERVSFQSFYIINAILVSGSPSLLEKLAQRNDVARLEGNPTIKQTTHAPLNLSAVVAASDTPNAVEPGVLYVGAPAVWGNGHGGEGIVIAGCDTGIAWDVSCLKNKYRGYNISTGQADHSRSWHDAVHSGGGTCGFDSKAPCDDGSHGTHTIGTTCGSDTNNDIGVAPKAKFIGCRNMDRGNGKPSLYIECMEWCLAPYPPGTGPEQGDPAYAPDLSTNSWGCPTSEGCSASSLHDATEATVKAGIMFVVAAGNSGSSCGSVSDPPGTEPSAFTVAAISSSNGALASFSSRGPVAGAFPKPEIAAPGVNVRSCVPGNRFQSMSGTSMATPHVAGAVALLWSAVPALKHRLQSTLDLLESAADPKFDTSCSSAGGVPNNLYGFGNLRVDYAVSLAEAKVTPTAATVEEDGGSVTVSVGNIEQALSWKAYTNETWLTLSGKSYTGPASLTVTVAAGGPRVGQIVVAGKRVTINQRDEA